MKDKSNLSNASDYFNANNVSGISKNNALNLTKLSNESNDFKELNKEIFQIIQQGGNLSGFNNTNLSISSNNNSNSLPSFNDINWKKKCSHENSSFFDNKNGNNSSISSLGIVPKKQIEVLNMRNTFDEKDISYNNNIQNNNNISNYNNNNINNNNNNNNNYYKNNNYNGNNYHNKYNKFSLIPEDSEEPPLDNKIHFTNVKKINKNENKFNISNNNINNNFPINSNIASNNNNNNLMLNYTNILNISNTTNISSKNFVKKNNFQNMQNNPNNNSNININNIRTPQNTNPNYLYYQNQLNPNINNINNINNMNNINNYFYSNQPQQYMFPENAFSYNNSNTNQTQNNNMNYQSNQSNWKDNNEKKNKNKKKFKDKIEQKLFFIDLDNIIKGTDERTTVMIRHIPNKYTSQTLLDELNTICKNKYDFFYLPIDNDNDCNLGYAFINFINPLHIVHFYHIFKARKWKLYKSNKECDLTFAKFQGKSELTANLDKNMNKIEDKKKLPMVFDVLNPPKIDLEKRYYDEIKMNRSELLKDINWI